MLDERKATHTTFLIALIDKILPDQSWKDGSPGHKVVLNRKEKKASKEARVGGIKPSKVRPEEK